MRIKHAFLALSCATALHPAPAAAQDYLTGYVGMFDMRDNDDDNEAMQFGLEYRFDPWRYGFRPTLGFNFTTEGSLYGYGGLNWDIEIMENSIYLIPNFMVGAYSDGSGKDLGGTLEFRTGIELAYEFPNTHRLGIAFNHISNANIYDHNPGAETLLINYSVPVGAIFSR